MAEKKLFAEWRKQAGSDPILKVFGVEGFRAQFIVAPNNGKWLIASQGSDILVWELPSGMLRWTLKESDTSLDDIAYAAEAEQLACLYGKRLWYGT